MASPAVTDPPGELMYRLMSAREFSADSSSSWAHRRLATRSSTSVPRTMIRWSRSLAVNWSSSVPAGWVMAVMLSTIGDPIPAGQDNLLLAEHCPAVSPDPAHGILGAPDGLIRVN